MPHHVRVAGLLMGFVSIAWLTGHHRHLPAATASAGVRGQARATDKLANPFVQSSQTYPALGVAATGDALCVDIERSIVHWLGTKIGGRHEGTVRIANGYLSYDETGITGGAFTVDMRSIDVTDIPLDEVEARRNLLHHLAHEEFFGVERFPTAGFVATDVVGIGGDVYAVSGNLAIRDSTHSVNFEATVPVLTAKEVRAHAAFPIDRRRWGVEFDGLTSLLRNAIVRNEISLTIRLLATTAACEKR